MNHNCARRTNSMHRIMIVCSYHSHFFPDVKDEAAGLLDFPIRPAGFIRFEWSSKYPTGYVSHGCCKACSKLMHEKMDTLEMAK
jgi:hypothetical protein